MNHDVPLWLDVLVMAGAGAFAGGAAAAVTGRDVKSRAVGSSVAFAMMTLAWRLSAEAENKMRVSDGLPPKPGR